MSTTPVLGQTELVAAQNQPHIPINSNARLLEVVTQLVVTSIRDTPPGSPVDGDRHIVGPTPTGAWAANAGNVAFYAAGWRFVAPQKGWIAFVTAAGVHYQYTADSPAAWDVFSTGGGGGSSLTVEEVGGSPGETVTAVTTLEIVGGHVDSPSAGIARLILPSGGGGGGTSDGNHKTQVGDGSGDFVGVGPGTSGQVLTSNGASADPTFQTPAGGSADGDLIDGLISGVFGWSQAQVASGSYVHYNHVMTWDASGSVANGAPDGTSSTIETSNFFYTYTNGGANAHAQLYCNNVAQYGFMRKGNPTKSGGFKCGIAGGWRDRSGTVGTMDSCAYFMGWGDATSNADTLASNAPSALTNIMGVGKDAGDTNLQFMVNDGSGSASKTDLGIQVSTLTGHMLHLVLTAPRGGASIAYDLYDVDTDTHYTGTVSANMPASTVLLGDFCVVNTLASGGNVANYVTRVAYSAGA